MNRHQRRAAQHQQSPKSPKANRSSAAAVTSQEPGPFGDDDALASDLMIAARSTQTGFIDFDPVGAQPRSASPKKQSLITRLLAKVLLSRWILDRIQHPDVERLLISFATEAGRHDIADSLIRRQATRHQELF